MSTNSSANATSTQLPPPDLVLFFHTMSARSKSATLSSSVGQSDCPAQVSQKAAACDIASICPGGSSHRQGGAEPGLGRWKSDTTPPPPLGSANQQCRRYQTIRPQASLTPGRRDGYLANFKGILGPDRCAIMSSHRPLCRGRLLSPRAQVTSPVGARTPLVRP